MQFGQWRTIAAPCSLRSTTARTSYRAPRLLPTIPSLGPVLRTSPQPPLSRKRFSGVLGMFSSLEVKVLYPT